MKSTLPCGRPAPHHSSAKPTSKNQKAPQKDPKQNWKPILTEYLKKQGLRTTPQRDRVAEIALAHQSHFEIQTLIREVQSAYPDISPATVYRNVATLCDAGILRETLQSQTGVMLYEAAEDDHHHDHIVCLDCNEIFEFHDDAQEKAQQLAIQNQGFIEQRHQHVIYAHCVHFQKKRT
jgi:Fur family ferric uptake transcriptional regulator